MKSLDEIQDIKAQKRELAYRLLSIIEDAIDETRADVAKLPLVEKDTLLALFITREMGAPGLGRRIAERVRAVKLL
jgi:hypothetical protein